MKWLQSGDCLGSALCCPKDPSSSPVLRKPVCTQTGLVPSSKRDTPPISLHIRTPTLRNDDLTPNCSVANRVLCHATALQLHDRRPSSSLAVVYSELSGEVGVAARTARFGEMFSLARLLTFDGIRVLSCPIRLPPPSPRIVKQPSETAVVSGNQVRGMRWKSEKHQSHASARFPYIYVNRARPRVYMHIHTSIPPYVHTHHTSYMCMRIVM